MDDEPYLRHTHMQLAPGELSRYKLKRCNSTDLAPIAQTKHQSPSALVLVMGMGMPRGYVVRGTPGVGTDTGFCTHHKTHSHTHTRQTRNHCYRFDTCIFFVFFIFLFSYFLTLLIYLFVYWQTTWTTHHRDTHKTTTTTTVTTVTTVTTTTTTTTTMTTATTVEPQWWPQQPHPSHHSPLPSLHKE